MSEHEDRLAVVEGKVDKIQDDLHLLVDTINVILKKLNKNLPCDEKMDISDDDDDDDDDEKARSIVLRGNAE